MFDNIQPIIQFLHNHPHSAGLFTFFVVFCEAMAVLGVVVPGTITMTAIGILAGMGVIGTISTFAWAIAGAILGDCLSYFIGVYYKDRLRKMWPFNRHPEWLAKSEKFFHHHGGKSVFIGRFIGPMRAMTPLVAGMLKMPVTRFLLAAIPSVSLWAVAYILPGVFLGVLSMELPPKIATEFALGILAVVILLWLISWLIHHFFKQLYRGFECLMKVLWKFLRAHKMTRWLPKLLGDGGYKQLALLIIALFSAIAFLVVLYSVLTHGYLTFLNEPIFYLLRSVRGPRFDDVMIAITLLGEKKVVLGAAGLFFIWLIYRRYWYFALHYAALFLLCDGVAFVFKILHIVTRPGMLPTDLDSSSFPSGHTTLIFTFLGFWAAMLSRELKLKQRWLPYLGAAIVIFLVIFSRLYLGAHWLTDVIAAIFISLTSILLVIISYYRKNHYAFDVKRAFIVAISIFGVVWLLYTGLTFHKQVGKYIVNWPVQTITWNDWQKHNANLPLYRLGRLGEPVQVFNLEWAGELPQIKKSLMGQGWEEQPMQLDFRAMINCLFGDSIYRYFPLLPQLYHNRPPVLVLTKKVKGKDTILILELWQSDISLTDVAMPLWLGAVHYNQKLPRIFALHKPRNHTKFVGATDRLINDLNGFATLPVNYDFEQQAQGVRDLYWDGELLLIWAK